MGNMIISIRVKIVGGLLDRKADPSVENKANPGAF